MKVIALSGKLESGKSTTAKYLNQKLPKSGRASFADELRKFLIDFLDISEELVYTSDKSQLTHLKWENMPHILPGSMWLGLELDSRYMTVREVLEHVGTEVMRRMNEDVWAKRLCDNVKSLQLKTVIVDDLRFPNEAKYLKKTFGDDVKFVRLTRTTEKGKENKHISNVALDDFMGWDAIVDNQNMTVEQASNHLDRLLQAWGFE